MWIYGTRFRTFQTLTIFFGLVNYAEDILLLATTARIDYYGNRHTRCDVDDVAYLKINFRIRSEASTSPPGKKRTTKMKIAPKMMR
jgi:hypothetical protein